jgi:glycosyltransferase involved in cell wall biosynthesis
MLNLAIFTNMLSIHQIPLGNALANRLHDDFKLVCWEPTTKDRVELGWKNDYEQEWIIKPWISENEKQKALDLIQSADVVVWGYAPVSEINRRVVKGKLTFLYTERPFKRGRWRMLDPRVASGIYNLIKFSNKDNYHLLSVGPYCADDFRFLGAFNNRMWRWGYFPEAVKFKETKNSHDIPTILWVGRMLSWKRVDLILEATAWVRDHSNQCFKIRIIGNGPEEEHIYLLANQLKLTDLCTFDSSKPYEETLHAMKQSEIYILSSDKNEGWGAVVNEAMCQGCCVIGNISTGSVPWLIKDGVNGFVFNGKNSKELGKILLDCLEKSDRTNKIGMSAQNDIFSLWSPTIAADRLLKLIEAINYRKISPFQDGGPCSPA